MNGEQAKPLRWWHYATCIKVSAVLGIFQARVLQLVAISFQGIELESPTLQPDVLLSEPPGKSLVLMDVRTSVDSFMKLGNYKNLELARHSMKAES